MNPEFEKELETAIEARMPLDEVVALLRRFKHRGITQANVYSFLERLHHAAIDEPTDDRILEIADFVAGFCSPHMRIWDSELATPMRR